VHVSPGYTRVHVSPGYTRVHVSPGYTRVHVSPGYTRVRGDSAGGTKRRERSPTRFDSIRPFRIAAPLANTPLSARSVCDGAARGRSTAMKKLRIVMLRFGTARQKLVLERWTHPKPLQPIWDCAAI
jgi:hypothetical protein